MDILDRAQQAESKFVKQALKIHKESTGTMNSSKYCVDCDLEIPEERRDALPGCLRCVECQETFEREID